MILPQAESLETSALAAVLQATHSGTRSLFTQSPGSTSVNRDDAGPSCHTAEDRGSEERLPEDRDDGYCSPCLPNLTSASKVSSDSTSSRKPSWDPSPPQPQLLTSGCPSCPGLSLTFPTSRWIVTGHYLFASPPTLQAPWGQNPILPSDSPVTGSE